MGHDAMRCPYCQKLGSRVVDSRTSDEVAVVRRRRECPACSRRFTTYERVGEVRLMVMKKDGRKEAFDRAKILSGMAKACEKRPITKEEIERAAEEIERAIRDGLDDEVEVGKIGAAVMAKLRDMDDVAYVRFASVYKEFRDTKSFVREVEDLSRENGEQVGRQTEDPAGVAESQESS
jgi:transcriptional repressor NrdR